MPGIVLAGQQGMQSRARLFGHAIHPMLVGFPIAYYTATFVTLLAYRGTLDPFWQRVSLVANVAGVVSAAIAAIPGIIDALGAIPRATAPRQMAWWHGLLNGSALLLFAANIALQWDPTTPHDQIGVLLTGGGMVATLFAGHYGGRLVQTYHAGIPDTLALPPGEPEPQTGQGSEVPRQTRTV